MDFVVVGLNHETAPIEIREKTALNEQHQQEFLHSLKQHPIVAEAASLFTCNRSEIYLLGHCPSCNKNASQFNCTQENRQCTAVDDSLLAIFASLQRYHNLHMSDLKPFIYQYSGINMVKHLMQVASGLDSMILGEPQILGQVKQSYQAAITAGSSKQIFARLFEYTFRTAKAVRTQTQIGVNPISIPFVVMTLAKQFYETLSDKQILFIGAGDMIHLSSRHLHQHGAKNLHFANRTQAKAQVLAETLSGNAISVAEALTRVHEFDLIISCTSSSSMLINEQHLEKIWQIKANKRTLLIDLAVPRDICKPQHHQKSLYYFGIDHLSNIIDQSKLKRSEAVSDATKIIDQYSENFAQWLRLHSNQKSLVQLADFAQQQTQLATTRALKKLAQGTDPEEVVQTLSQQLKKQLMHPPMQALRQAISEDKTAQVALISNIYNTPKSPS